MDKGCNPSQTIMDVAPHETSSPEGHELDRVLTFEHLICFGIGRSLGAGIYVTIGSALINCAGPSVCLSFIVGGMSAMFTAVCYAEMASQPALCRKSGSAYAYVTASFGPAAGFVCGWFLSLGYILGAAAVARGWASYCAVLLGDMVAPGTWTYTVLFQEHSFLEYSSNGLFSLQLAPVVMLILLLILVLKGTKESANFNTGMTCLNLMIIGVFICIGLLQFDAGNMTPFFQAPHGPGGVTGVVSGAGLVYFAFLGFDGVTALAGEAKQPERTIPKAVVSTVLGVTTIYALCAVALAGMQSANDVSSQAPLTAALQLKGHHKLASLVGFGALMSSAANAFCALLSQPRIWFAMAADGLLPRDLLKVHPTTKVPQSATLLAGLSCALLSGLLHIDHLVKITSASSLAVYSAVALGLCKCKFESSCEKLCPNSKVITQLALVAYACSSTLFGILLPTGSSPFVLSCAATGCILAAIVLIALWVQNHKIGPLGSKQTFIVPGGPVIPLIAVLINSVLMGYIGWETMRHLFLWTMPAIALYVASKAAQDRSIKASERMRIL